MTLDAFGRHLNVGLGGTGPRGNQILLSMAEAGLLIWTVVGMGAGLRPADADVQPVTSVAWSAKKALKWALLASVLGFVSLFVWGLFIFGWSNDDLPSYFTSFSGAKISVSRVVVAVGISGGLIGGVAGFTFGGWIARLRGKVMLSPNQGVRSSLAFGLRMGLVGLSLCAPAWIASPQVGIDTMGLVATFLMLAFGGQDVIHHAVLRALLAWRGCAPLQYVRFLNHAVNLAFLQRSGGAYLFIHRTFQEHLAAKRDR